MDGSHADTAIERVEAKRVCNAINHRNKVIACCRRIQQWLEQWWNIPLIFGDSGLESHRTQHLLPPRSVLKIRKDICRPTNKRYSGYSPELVGTVLKSICESVGLNFAKATPELWELGILSWRLGTEKTPAIAPATASKLSEQTIRNSKPRSKVARCDAACCKKQTRPFLENHIKLHRLSNSFLSVRSR